MACLPNLFTLQNLDFSGPDDSANWFTDSLNPVFTSGGKLILNPSSATSRFERILGTPNVANNRIRLRVNFDLNAIPIGGPSNIEVLFELIAATTVIGSGCAELSAFSRSIYSYYLDRTFNLSVPVTSPVTLRITVPSGFQYQLELEDLIAEDFFFCEDNIRTYFALEGIFDAAYPSMSSAIELLEWKVDGVETLTPAFFSENSIVGHNPFTEWLLAEGDLDGFPRVSDNLTPNTYNPFYEEWGLDFPNIAGNYFGGLTTGTRTGSNYGSAILKTGVDLPTILNGSLVERKAPFFIDLNYEESFTIRFNVLVNPSNSNPFIGPTIYRTYTIQFDKDTCERSFTYFDQLTSETIDVNVDGFLYGLVPQSKPPVIVDCGETYGNLATAGNTVYQIEFGANTGIMQFDYNAVGVPDRFIFDWDGNQVDTGYVGLSSFDTDLINAGVLPIDINTTPLGNGQGSITLNKANPSPSFVTVTVLSPLEVNWNVNGICIGGINPTCSIVATNSPQQVGVAINFNLAASAVGGTIASWSVDFGDGNDQSGVGAPPASVNNAYGSVGNFTVNFTVTDSNGNVCVDTVNAKMFAATQALEITANESNSCNSCLNFTVTVPTGKTYDLVVSSSFNPPAVWASGFCGGGTIIAGNGTIVLTAGTYQYNTGIDAAQQQSNPLSSNIFIRIKEGANTLQTYTLFRGHTANIC